MRIREETTIDQRGEGNAQPHDTIDGGPCIAYANRQTTIISLKNKGSNHHAIA